MNFGIDLLKTTMVQMENCLDNTNASHILCHLGAIILIQAVANQRGLPLSTSAALTV